MAQRVIRIFRLGRYTDGSTVVRETLRASSAAVGLMAFFMIVLTLFFAAIVYYSEMGRFMVTPVRAVSPSLPPSFPHSLPPSFPPTPSPSRFSRVPIPCLTDSHFPLCLCCAFLRSYSSVPAPPSLPPSLPPSFPPSGVPGRRVHSKERSWWGHRAVAVHLHSRCGLLGHYDGHHRGM